ncbi:hypothetical protein ACFWUQ_01220 [Streptomyces sp. NPDC058662]|uniref:hypothetical protein n=1 Tax=Streptomyces sp. NPDC058662 TaxID=3346583 RepID=UPI00365D115A
MGIYLYAVGADDWSDEEVLRPTALALDAELARRGWPAWAPAWEPAAGAAHAPEPGFSEKLNRPMDGFSRLCRAQPGGREDEDALLDWNVLVPLPFTGRLALPEDPVTGEEMTVRSAHRALAAAERLAAALALPAAAAAAAHRGALGLTNWFAGPAVAEAAAARPGPWTGDLDAAYCTAVHLAAARYALRWNRPMHYS